MNNVFEMLKQMIENSAQAAAIEPYGKGQQASPALQGRGKGVG